MRTLLPNDPAITARFLAGVLALLVALGLPWSLRSILDHHEGTAAWVQAVGAILIIGATAWIAGRSSREARERERRAEHQVRESIATLARHCLKALDTLLEKHPARQMTDPRGNFRRSYVPSDFEVPMDGLAAVPLHQVGDAALITAIVNLRGVMGRIKKHLDDVLGNPAMSESLKDVRNQRQQALNAVASILRIVEGNAAEAEISRIATRSAW